MSFQQGLSGLDAASQNLDVIGNNVANSNTVGFKQGTVNFADVYAASLGGGTGGGVGLGTQVTGVEQQFTQGTITATNNPLDVAINGNGFLRMSSNGAINYSRDGELQLDKNGFLVGPTGNNVTGYLANNGVIVPGVLGNLQLSSANVPPAATAKVEVGANLTSSATPPAVAFDPTNPASYNYSTSTTTYDTLGQSHTMTLYFNNTAANAWNVNAYVDGVAGGTSTLGFDSSGKFVSASNALVSATPANGASPMSIAMDFSNMTQYGSASGVNSLSQDGYASGQLSGYNIGTDGAILGSYTNGQSKILGQIALVNFANPQGLTPLGGNAFGETAASGAALAGAPGSASLGVLQSSALEGSNVDLTTDLVKLITAQRAYQANAQSIKTQDTVLNTLVNL